MTKAAKDKYEEELKIVKEAAEAKKKSYDEAIAKLDIEGKQKTYDDAFKAATSLTESNLKE